MAELKLPRRWPGFTRESTLLLHLPRAVWPPPSAPVAHDGDAFAPKAELHVTLIGSALGAALREQVALATIRRRYEAQDWVLERSGERRRLRKPGSPPRESIIELVHLPAMARFHAALMGEARSDWPVPPPHVTLYTRGDRRGIGVADAATLEALTVAAWCENDDA